jgi:hypothetical protein
MSDSGEWDRWEDWIPGDPLPRSSGGPEAAPSRAVPSYGPEVPRWSLGGVSPNRTNQSPAQVVGALVISLLALGYWVATRIIS